MRKLICILAIFASCANQEPAPAPANQFKIAYRSTPTTLDPIAENTVISDSIYCNIYEPLVVRDENLKLKPALAEDWTNPDDLTWIFKLRDRVLFHDGSTMTAEDVVYSLERARKDPTSQIMASLAAVDTVEMENPGSIRITTHRPYSILVSRLVDIWILKKNAAPIGTGPYKVASWKPGEYVQLKAHPEYWGGPPQVDAIRFESVPDLRARIGGLVGGKFQILPLLEPEALTTITAKDLQGLSIQTSSSLATLLLGMDLARPKTPYSPAAKNPFLDLRVRQAIYHAINIDYIVRDILLNYASPATQIVAPKVFGFNESLRRSPYDPEKARKLLTEAGFPEGFSVRLDITNNRYRNDTEVGKAILNDLAAVGIHVQLNELPVQQFIKLLETRDTSFFMLGFTLPSTDASGAFDFLIHTRDDSRGYGIHNAGGYSNLEVDHMIEHSSEIMKPSERGALLTSIMERVMSDLPLIPLHVENSVSACTLNVQWTSRPDEFIYCKNIKIN